MMTKGVVLGLTHNFILCKLILCNQVPGIEIFFHQKSHTKIAWLLLIILD